MRKMTEYIELYADRELKVPLPRVSIDGKRYWRLNFGRIEAGQTKTFQIFIENQSMGTLENIEINKYPVDRPGVEVTLLRNRVKKLELTEVHAFYVKWSVAEAALTKAGKATVDLTISGEMTEEI